eukprot:TRINITY_DN6311_c0_g2_i2.p1 TRINITY_DN6311_c0_g2~~TRINITY_DN6311_c0_g2_i2.p1  ORF type:complete len:205 (+),score=32.78 TRINITY_DN6311_c0_g2_i2:94-708(+)
MFARRLQRYNHLTRPLSQSKDVSVYFHWPYCASICPYCDFNRYQVDTIDHPQMQLSYLKEIEKYLNITDPYASIKSIYFGGGTPSLSKPSMIKNILDSLQKKIPFADDIEITMEANPTSIETETLAQFKEAGINRLSMGIQSFNDDDLKYLGRNHTSSEAIDCIHIASDIFGIERITFDLIYSRNPSQTKDSWREELQVYTTIY